MSLQSVCDDTKNLIEKKFKTFSNTIFFILNPMSIIFFYWILLYFCWILPNTHNQYVTPAHSCLSEKWKMEAPKWKNTFNTFLHRIINLPWLFCLYDECWICWWYLVVTHQIVAVVIGHFHTSAKLQRLCGQDFSFCGGYAPTRVYSRLDRWHKNAILGRDNQWLIKNILGQQNIHPDEPSNKNCRACRHQIVVENLIYFDF